MLPLITAALQGLAALPKLTDAIRDLGEHINHIAANERLEEKRSRNRDAVRAVLDKRMSGGATGSGGGTDKPPSV